MELRERVDADLREHGLLGPGGRVLLGISGGVDSMVLLHLLAELAPKHRWSLAVAHFNHCLRGADSDGDEAFVRATTEKLDLPFHAGRADVRAFADNSRLSIEMAARELRYDFLIDTAKEIGAERIALAHHADDHIETFWLRLLRGDVGRGLAGIRWIRPSGKGDVSIVRPLLNVRKSELMAFAREKRIEFRQDASNDDPTYARNRLRIEILPSLEKFQPELRDLTQRTAQVLGDEKDFLEREAQKWLAQPTPHFNQLHVALQREIVRQQLLPLGVKPNFELIEELRLNEKQPITWSPGFHVTRSGEGFLSADEGFLRQFSDEDTVVDLTDAGFCEFQGVQIAWEFVDARGPNRPNAEFFDLETIGTRVVIRLWRPGDRFQPSGMGSEAKVQDLLTNLKVPANEKRRRLVAVAADGKIFWVEGLRISERHKVTERTRRILSWSWRRVGQTPSGLSQR